MANDLRACAHETILSANPGIELAALQQLGVTGVRIGAVWGLIEPTKGKFTGYTYTPATQLPMGFEAVDRAVDAARALGLEVNLLLNLTAHGGGRPGWAGTGSHADFANFCKQAALRYGPKGVTQYEIGNEWNVGANWDMGSWWQPGGYIADEIANHTKSASIQIKSVQPGAIIVSCGMAACVDWNNRWGSRGPAQRSPSGMVKDLLARGCGPHIDKIGYHPYTLANDLSTWQPPRPDHPWIVEVLNIRNAVVAHNEAQAAKGLIGIGDKPIECTEWGWSNADYTEAVVSDFITTEWDILHNEVYGPLIANHYLYCGKDFVYPGNTATDAVTAREARFGLLNNDCSPKLHGTQLQSL